MKKLIGAVFIILLAGGCGQKVVQQVEPPPDGYPGMNPYQVVVVTGSVVNLRQGPGTEYAIVGRAVAGDSLLVTGEAPDWYRIYDAGNSLFAWIYSPLTSGAVMPGEEQR